MHRVATLHLLQSFHSMMCWLFPDGDTIIDYHYRLKKLEWEITVRLDLGYPDPDTYRAWVPSRDAAGLPLNAQDFLFTMIDKLVTVSQRFLDDTGRNDSTKPGLGIIDQWEEHVKGWSQQCSK